jgi:hypothetical protein
MFGVVSSFAEAVPRNAMAAKSSKSQSTKEAARTRDPVQGDGVAFVMSGRATEGRAAAMGT